MLHISLASETIFYIGSLPITNTLIMSWLAMIVLGVFAYLATRKQELIPRGIQNFFEALIEGILNLVQSVTENRKQAIQFLPLVATILLFITVSNWMGLLPGVGTIGFYETHEAEAEVAHEEGTDTHSETMPIEKSDEEAMESEHPEETAVTEEHSDEGHAEEVFVPLFRSTYSDVNMTLAIALISIFMAQFFGIAAIGVLKYGKKFINFSNPINFFVGLLELIGEVSRIISFTFRLFGNVFAGEVLLVVIAVLVPYLAPVPFYFLEVFVGFIQALVFALLTLVFVKTATIDHEAH